MYRLSEQAQKLIDDFEKQIEVLPVEERNEVLKKMTSHVCALNEDVKDLFKTLQTSRGLGGTNKTQDKDINHISDYL